MAFPSTGTIDTFNRANTAIGPGTASSGAIWSSNLGDIFGTGGAEPNVVGNQLSSAVETVSSSAWLTDNFPADVEVYCDIGTLAPSTDSLQLYARLANPGTGSVNGYAVYINPGAGSYDVYRIDAGIKTQLGAGIAKSGSATAYGFQIVGSQIDVYEKVAGVWSASLGSRTDSTYSAAGKTGAGCGFFVTTASTMDNLGGTGPAVAAAAAAAAPPRPLLMRLSRAG